MARRIGTQREVEALAAAADFCESQGLPFSTHLRSLHEKITRPKPKLAGADIAGIEYELVTRSNGRVVKAVGGQAFWIAQSRKYGELGATREDAALVGDWLSRQGWMKQVYTVDTFARWWPNALGRAKAELESGQTHDTGGWSRPEFDD